MTASCVAHEYDERSVRDNGLSALLSAAQNSLLQERPGGGIDSLHQMSRQAIRWRRARRDMFPEAALRDTSWDIMLLCLTGEIAGRPMCVKQIRTELEESQTSVLRRIDELEKAGMLCRLRDAMDGRRTLVRLSREGALAMVRFFEAMVQGPGHTGASPRTPGTSS